MAYTPKGWTRPTTKTRKDGVKIIRVAGRNYSRATFASMDPKEKDTLQTLNQLWNNFLTPSQNLTISRELGKEGLIGIDEGFRWIVRLGNLERAKAWVEKGKQRRQERYIKAKKQPK